MTGVEKNTQFSPSKSPYLRNDAGEDQGYNDGLTESCICAFDFYKNHRPWMTFNGRYSLCGSKDASYSPPQKIRMKIDSCYQQ